MRSIQTPQINAGGAVLTVNIRIANHLARVAYDAGLGCRKALADMDAAQAAAALREVHGHVETVRQACDDAAEAARQLHAAARLLEGDSADTTGPIVDTAEQASSMIALLRATDDSLDLSAAADTAHRLRSVGNALAEDVQAARKRLASLDALHRSCVDAALAAHADVRATLRSYAPTAALGHALDAAIAEGKGTEALRHLARDALRAASAGTRSAKRARQAVTAAAI